MFTPGEPDAMFVQQSTTCRWRDGLLRPPSGMGRRLVDRRRNRRPGAPRRAGRTRRRHRADDLRTARAARGAFGAIANLNRRYVRLRQIKSAEELDWMRIGAALTDRGMAGAARRAAAGAHRTRARRSRRAILRRARRHQRHPLFRRHRDGGATDRRADAIRREPQSRARRYRLRRDQRRVLGPSRPGVAQLRGGRRAAASSIATCTPSPTRPSTRSPLC